MFEFLRVQIETFTYFFINFALKIFFKNFKIIHKFPTLVFLSNVEFWKVKSMKCSAKKILLSFSIHELFINDSLSLYLSFNPLTSLCLSQMHSHRKISLIGKCVSYVNSSFHLFTGLCLFIYERERWKIKTKTETTILCWANMSWKYFSLFMTCRERDFQWEVFKWTIEKERENWALNRALYENFHFECIPWVDNALSNLQ